MTNKLQHRFSKDKKEKIAQNLIDILQKDAIIDTHTRSFISDWILSGPKGKRKAFYDIWDIVLSNYLPTTRPILFRACQRKGNKKKISSFTSRLVSAARFSQGKGILIICDTKENIDFEQEFLNKGEYKYTFYPLVNVLKKAKELGGCGFTESFLNDYIGEDEYIMRTEPLNTYRLKWMKDDL